MPCKCYYTDLITKYPAIVLGGALTCGNCDTVSSGDFCVFYCANGDPMTFPDPFGVLRPGGLFSAIPCTNDGWPDFNSSLTSFTLPLCPLLPDVCPPVLGLTARGTSLGFSPQVKAPSVCVGATITDTCTVSCAPAFYAPGNNFVATCTKFVRDGVEVLDWYPWNLNTLYGHEEICVCQGCMAGGIDDKIACPCKVNQNFSETICPA